MKYILMIILIIFLISISVLFFNILKLKIRSNKRGKNKYNIKEEVYR